MTPVFEILPNVLTINTEKSNLFIELSRSGISYTVENESDKAFTGVSLYNFEKINSPVELSAELKQLLLESSLLNNKFAKTIVFISLPECLQVPANKYNVENVRESIEFVFGDLFDHLFFADEVAGSNIINVYSIPLLLHNTIREEFPEARFIHQNTILIRSLPSEGDHLNVLFYPGSLVACLVKEGKLQLVQHFAYQSGEDVAWHLLNLCKQFNMKDVLLTLGGMIDVNSSLYNDIYKYFLNISFYALPSEVDYDESIKELPQHFFSPLFSAALCE
ncbi:MAG: DUF3822 family protein [Chitinophagaceae bacterium]